MTSRVTFYRCYGKRLFDLALTVPALVLLAPVLLVLAVLVRWRLGTPIFFRQQRPGRNEQPFTLVKCRTMTDARDATGRLLPDSQRLTALGRFLRATSLDELPELLNVLKGDMSLVGPRPLLMQYLPYYTAEERRRFAMLPGITGWAQVHGRNAVAWDRRLALDVWYVEHTSLVLDLRILARTLIQVIRRADVAVDTQSAETYLDEERRDQKPTDSHPSACKEITA
jgi:lipopolysaccharide/colanic/teichoic acid biosynthesis glycosyltransferase